MVSRKAMNAKIRGFILSVVTLVAILSFLLLRHSNTLTADLLTDMDSMDALELTMKVDPRVCSTPSDCPADHFGFYIRSGAGHVVPPKICVRGRTILAKTLQNAGHGINIVVLNGRTGEVTKTANFDMWAGEVEPLISFLKNIQEASIVMIASYDDPATKLNDEARKLIADMGSSVILTLGFRDNWVFVGGKGPAVNGGYEKHMKNDQPTNKYTDWPELIDISGCVPKFLE